MVQNPTTSGADRASTADIRAILGALNESDLLEITALHPTIRDLEEAVTWLSGDRDVFGAGEPLKDVAAGIVAVLLRDEEEEADRKP
jgi:hypothetical protein